eukprot:gene45291-56413_t
MAEPTPDSLPILPMIAAIQMNSTPVVADNLATAARLLAEAAEAGAVLAALPENFSIMGVKETDKLAHAETFGRGPIQDWLAETAQRLGLWIVAGTVPVAVDGDPGRVWAASLVFDARGAQRRLDRRQHMALYDAQQDIVAGHVEALAELLFREKRHRRSGAFEPVGVDDEIGRAATHVDAGDVEHVLGRLAARLARDLEEAACVAAEIAGDLGVESVSTRGAGAAGSSSFQPIIIQTRSR